jgi:colanic acid/amylovoran biosynthesis glycosyltransferase
MEQADIFLQPSQTAADGDSEGGAPTTLLEAQAMGLPVVASDHADIPYVVAPGEPALLPPQGDTGQLAAALGQLLDEPLRWAEMGRRGRRHVEAQHDLRIETQRLEARYLALLEAGR